MAVAEQDGSASLPFYARYYATDAATAGKVASLRQLYGGLSVTPSTAPLRGRLSPDKEEVNMRRMVLALLLSSYLPSADASMVIDGTRIIFPGDKKRSPSGPPIWGDPL